MVKPRAMTRPEIAERVIAQSRLEMPAELFAGIIHLYESGLIEPVLTAEGEAAWRRINWVKTHVLP